VGCLTRTPKLLLTAKEKLKFFVVVVVSKLEDWFQMPSVFQASDPKRSGKYLNAFLFSLGWWREH
jgi:hypothetical protein